jgi:hypothetical protein
MQMKEDAQLIYVNNEDMTPYVPLFLQAFPIPQGSRRAN